MYLAFPPARIKCLTVIRDVLKRGDRYIYQLIDLHALIEVVNLIKDVDRRNEYDDVDYIAHVPVSKTPLK